MNAETSWTADDLRFLADVQELQIAAPRSNGEPGRWTPIWVVVADDEVFVRTWRQRTTGWYGHAVAAGRAWITVADATVEVAVTLTGEAHADAVDAAYRKKYGTSAAQSVTTRDAAASTLTLTSRDRA